MKAFFSILFGVFLLQEATAGSTLVINEFMASNGATIADEDEDYEDWIELYNAGSEPVNLKGWGLSDDPDNPLQWVFSEWIIQPNEFLLIWASGKDRIADPYQTEWYADHTEQAEGLWLFREGSGTTATDSSVHLNHGTLYGTAYTNRKGIAEALAFQAGDRIDLSEAIHLDADFTISFWLNAREFDHWRFINSSESWAYSIGFVADNIIRFNDPMEDMVLSKRMTADSWGHLVITRAGHQITAYLNGKQAGRITPSVIHDIRADRLAGLSAGSSWNQFEGEIGDVMILSQALSPEEVGALYKAQSDWFFHTNFRISREGDPLLLTSPQGVMDSVGPVSLPRDISYGRQPDGSDVWRYFGDPTPGAPNTTTGYDEVLEPPVFSHSGGFYGESFDLHISHPDPEVGIVYSLDGSFPDPGHTNGVAYLYKNQYPDQPEDDFGLFLTNHFQSYVYSSPITIIDRSPEPDKLTQMSSTWDYEPDYFPGSPVRKGTVVRARAVKPGALPSSAETHTFFVFPEHGHNPFTVPVISISVQEDALFDYYDGIYVPGVDFDHWRWASGAGERMGNFHRRGDDWEYPAHMEYFDTESAISALRQDMGIRIHGGWTRTMRLKSFRLYARNAYDASHFEYPFWGDVNDSAFKRLILRQAGNDATFALLRDPAIQTMVRHLNFDTQAYQPTVVFINGEYWGILNIRERYDAHYLERVYGVNPAKIDLLTGNAAVKEGDTNHFNDMLDYMSEHCLSNPDHYGHIQTRMDVDNFIDYVIANVFARNDDWPGNNIDFWRLRTSEYVPDAPVGHDGRWRWMLYDTDFGFGYSELHGDRFSMDMLSYITDPERPRHVNFMMIHLLKNEGFQRRFINRFADLLNTTFLPERTIAVIEDLKQGIAEEVPRHQARWRRPVGSWVANVGVMTHFAHVRPGYQRQHIRDFFDLEDDVTLELDVNESAGGHIRVNSVRVTPDTPGVPDTPYPWTGQYFHGIPLEVEADPAPGFRFHHWEGVDEPMKYSPVATLDMTRDETLTAVFEATTLLHYWSFNDTNNLLAPTYTLGEASISVEPGPDTEVTSDTGQDFYGENNRLGENPGAHLRLNNPIGATVTIALPTTGYKDLLFQYEARRSGSGAGTQILEYTTNGVVWEALDTVTIFDDLPVLQSFDLSDLAGVNDNTGFAIRIAFEEGDGGDEGNNRLDNISLEGNAAEGVKQPPAVDNPPELMTGIEGGEAVTLDLRDVFSDPDEEELNFGADIARTNIASVTLSDYMLELTGLRRGETDVTISADDGENPPVFSTFRLLIYPAAHDLPGGSYTFNFWDPDTPELTYPDHMLFLQSDESDTALDTPLLYAYHLEPEDYHADDESTIGFPYNNTGRTRISGLGADGISFINTGQDRDLGGALLAVDTTGLPEARVAWIGGTIEPNDRIYAIRLQYRVGTEGPFLNVTNELGAPLEYVRHETAGDVEAFGPVKLPADARDEPYVQLLWRYHRISGESGPRAELRLDDIVITTEEVGTVADLVFDAIPSAFQSGEPLGPVVVRAVDNAGLTVTSFEGPITLTLDGDGSLTGTLTISAVDGVATFEDLAVKGAGSLSLSVEAPDAGITGSSESFNIVQVTELIMPLYIQGDQDVDGNNLDRVPFAYRLQLDGLKSNATYRYGNRVVVPGDPPEQDGAGNMIFVTGADTNWIRNTDPPRFLHGDHGERHWTFTTDAEGSYTGWFVTEPTGNARFTPKTTLFMRLLLNDGSGGQETALKLSTTNPVTVVRFGEAGDEATGIMGVSAEAARNFVFLYDNTEGTGRPLAGVPIEITGSEVDDRYAAFYEQTVATTPHYWGTLIPNTLPTGVRRIEARAIGDGSILSAETEAGGFDGTVDPDGGLDIIILDPEEGIPTFLPPGDGAWDINANWSTGVYPDGVDAEAIIGPRLDDDRNVDLFSPVTIGHLIVDNATSTNRNRIQTQDENATLTFESSEGPAHLEIRGSGSGFVEFRSDEGGWFVLASDLLVTITNLNEHHGLEGVLNDDFGALRFRNDWIGSGGLIKDGPGVMTMTGGGKDYTGETVVDFGVLRVTEPATPTNTSAVTVNPGGQLRLVSDGDRVYPFGGTITLNSLGRGGDVPVGENLGILGALRYDPGSGGNRAEVTNAVTVAGSTSLHVDGPENRMDLTGPLSGSGAFSKSGGGMLLLSGDSSGYAVPVIVSNGMLRVNGSLGSSVWMDSDGRIGGSGTVGALSGLGVVAPGGATLTAPSVNGLNYRFTLTHGAGDLLRLTNETPFEADLNAANTIEIFIDVDSYDENNVFDGGFFTDDAGDFIGSISNATWTLYVRDDEEGDVEHEGKTYSEYEGALPERRTVPAVRDFGHGPVEGRLLRIGPRPGGSAPLSAWMDANFTAEELNDPEISKFSAVPDGDVIPNIVRYALGLNRGDPHREALPRASMTSENGDDYAVYTYRRLTDEERGVEYQVTYARNLHDDWESIDALDGIHWMDPVAIDEGLEKVRVRIPAAELAEILFLRLEIIHSE